MTMVNSQAVTDAADRLAAASRTREPCAPVRDLIGSDNIDAAYRVQQRNIETLLASGRRIVGRKIGLTSTAVQQQLGVDQPDFGVLTDDMDCSADAAVDFTRLLQPKVEAEIAFVLSADITGNIAADQAPHFVDGIYAAFEIVDSRVANWNISLADTIADNASSGLYVLGDRVNRADAPDLAHVSMTTTADGVVVSRGKGSDCLGSPWEALAWLANTGLAYGAPLRAGEVVLSGALGPMVPVTPGSTYTTTISGIGSATATFTTPSSKDNGL
ncbi:2-keto-4-pentenoate hydratase [Mycobacterium vulneris]|uniref:2-keto-4-pentenoate hydratase n=2 Tax=Mycolicibacterium vulneris TaxID=547163 RepID=A0A1X2KPF5_9MYCO|nr:2-keto-4-pentenoate hydratase [Mycolicibacterium vulneris]